jgi:mono/diheme cytochrome c family protein
MARAAWHQLPAAARKSGASALDQARGRLAAAIGAWARKAGQSVFNTVCVTCVQKPGDGNIGWEYAGCVAAWLNAGQPDYLFACPTP